MLPPARRPLSRLPMASRPVLCVSGALISIRRIQTITLYSSRRSRLLAGPTPSRCSLATFIRRRQQLARPEARLSVLLLHLWLYRILRTLQDTRLDKKRNILPTRTERLKSPPPAEGVAASACGRWPPPLPIPGIIQAIPTQS